METNQTAVEWLKERLPSLFQDDSGHYAELFKQAKLLEKAQMVYAFVEGYKKSDEPLSNELIDKFFIDYFGN
jgi:hypothetical protein